MFYFYIFLYKYNSSKDKMQLYITNIVNILFQKVLVETYQI